MLHSKGYVLLSDLTKIGSACRGSQSNPLGQLLREADETVYHWLCASPELRRSVSALVFGAGSQQNENLFRTTRFCTGSLYSVYRRRRSLHLLRGAMTVSSDSPSITSTRPLTTSSVHLCF